MTRYTRYGILGDPGAVSRIARKGGTKVFKHGRESPWVPTLTELFPKIQADAGSWLGTKKCFVLLCPISEQSLLSYFREFVLNCYCLATLARFVQQVCAWKETFIFYFPNQKRRNYRRVEKTFRILSAGAIEFAPIIFCFWRQLPDYPWKCLISRFVMDVNKQWQNSFSSWTWIWFIEIQLQKCSLAFDKVSELE